MPEPVRHEPVAQHAVPVEDVEPELALWVPRNALDEQVDVVVAVSPVEIRTAGKTEIHVFRVRVVASVAGIAIAVAGLCSARRLPATIDGAVVVHHGSVALVDVRRREIEHVVVEPEGAHGLAVVTRNLLDPTVAVRCSGPRIAGVRVDAVVPGEHHRPAVVVVLAGTEEGLGVAVALGRDVAVVQVGRESVRSEAHVGRG